jgi:tRNA nucleotidyltransferase (CCA-adding enzyme)
MKLNAYISRLCKKLVFFNENKKIVLKIQNKSKMSTSSSNKRFKVYVTQPIPNEAMEILKENDLDVNLNETTPLDRNTLLKSVKNIDALFCTLNEKINSELLNEAGDQLKVGFAAFELIRI